MADKKIVDDYYSSLKNDSSSNSSWDSSDSSKAKIKPKKVIKKKIIKKKVEEKTEEKKVVAKTASSNSDNKKTTIKKEVSKAPAKKKKFVQKIEVVKQEEKPASSRSNNQENKYSSNNNKDNKYSKKESKKVYKWPDKSKSSDDSYEKKSKRAKLKPVWKGKRARGRFNFFEEEKQDKGFVRSNKIAKKQKEEKKVEDIKQNLVSHKWETVVVPEVLTLKEFSEKIWVPLPQLIVEFMKNGMMVNINSKLDFDTAAIVAEAFEITLKRDDSEGLSVKDVMELSLEDLLKEDDPSVLQPRPPVISIMGHVDHGKTSLLDYIRKSNVTSWEAGWITQSIGAYQVEKNGQKITFLDTPWHEAFTVMRARWAKATDIAILVVAADEWVKPQTIESINHAKEANIPVIVAINKMDKEWANPDHVKGQLAEHGLTPEDWGGDTPMIPVSAHSGFGIDELLEMILLVAEMKELKANPNRPAIGTVLESHLDTKLWPVATVLINTWVINKWDAVVCSDSYWKIKVMKDYENRSIVKAFAWDPVLIVWLDKVVNWGDYLQVVANPSVAKEKAEEYRTIIQNREKNKASGLDVLMSKIKAWNLKQLKIVLKADTNWSLEAIKAALIKLSTPETNVSIIHSWVGAITEGDVLMCEWSSAILIGFNVGVVNTAKSAIEDTKIEFISSDVIYHITERVEKIVTWMLDPKEVEIILGRAKVGWIFFSDKKFMILWLVVPEWTTIEKWVDIRVIRKDKKVWTWKVTSLKQWVEEVKQIEWPTECWIRFEWNVKVEEGDTLEFYKTEIQK